MRGKQSHKGSWQQFHHMRLYFFLVLLMSFGTYDSNAQDTVRYVGVIADALIYESIELYPDSTFKWRSEYDLSWDEYGVYSIYYDTLVLNYTDAHSIDENNSTPKIRKTEVLIMDGSFLFRLDEKKQRITRQKDKSIRTKWSWILGYRHKYVIKTAANNVYDS